MINTVLQGDCLELMKAIPDKSIDLIVTDPPYKVISGGQTKTANNFYKNGLWKNDGKIFKYNDFDFTVDFFNEMYRVLKPNTHIYFFTNFLNLNTFLNLFDKSNFKMHNLLVWEKKPIVNRWYMKNVEYVIFARKGNAKPINNKGSNTVHYFEQPKDKLHPTEKPISLLEMYIKNSSNQNDIILDPFAGSGTTGVACKNTGRNFILMEKEQEYIDIINKRLG